MKWSWEKKAAFRIILWLLMSLISPPPLLLIPCKVSELAIKDNYRGTLSKLFLGEQQGHRLCVVKNLQSVFIAQILYNP